VAGLNLLKWLRAGVGIGADTEGCNSFAHAVNQPQVKDEFLPHPKHHPLSSRKKKKAGK
jgi:hypothetical protein